jgi:putative ABC transport system permease protein
MVAEAKAEAREGMSSMSTILVAFGVMALLVGSFVIANSFSITVAQRTKENMLTRAIGASRRQVLGAVLLESAATGLVASVVGVVLGIGVALGHWAMLAGYGLDHPSGPILIAPRTIFVSLIVGISVAVVAAVVPARKASRVPAMAALRDVSVDRSGRSLRRSVTGGVITLLGGGLLAAGLSGAGPSVLGLGAILVFCGVAVLGPVLARPAARLIGAR